MYRHISIPAYKCRNSPAQGVSGGYHDAVSTSGLRVIKRGVGRMEQGLAGSLTSVHRGHADAGGHREAHALRRGVGQTLHLLPHPLRHRGGPRRPGLREQNGQLFPTHARSQVHIAAVPLEHSGGGPENVIALTVPYNAKVELDIDDGRGVDIDGYVLLNGPDPSSCAERFDNKTEFYAAGGTVLYLVMDSDYPNDGGAYELEIECEDDD